MTQGHAFDVATVLGIGTPSSDPLPTAAEGEIVLRVAEGLSLKALRESEAGKAIYPQRWYLGTAWYNAVVETGVYRLRSLISGSQGRKFEEQAALLSTAEEPAPIALVAAAMLCLMKLGDYGPLRFQWARCRESTDGGHAAITWDGSRAYLRDYWDLGVFDDVGISSIQKLS